MKSPFPCRFRLLLATLVLAACTCCTRSSIDEKMLEPGVARRLAQYRKENFKDVRYRLHFSIPQERDLPVTGKLDFSAKAVPGKDLVLDFMAGKDQLKSVSVNGEPADYEFRNEHIVLPARCCSDSVYRVTLCFESGDKSLNRREDFIYTLFVPEKARTVFPCMDQPDMKARYDLQLEIPQGWKAVANGRVKDSTAAGGNGRSLITFEQTEPLSTYLFSFVTGIMDRLDFSRNGRDISIFHRETDPDRIAQCDDIAEMVFDALDWMEDYTAIPYPFAKYDLIIVPGFQFGGMEHTGATLYTDRRMFVGKHPTLNELLRRNALIAHETSHMWFGNYVTMEWFDDVWTKEVFANYLANKITAPQFKDINHHLNFMKDYVPNAYGEDRTAGTNAVKQDLPNLNYAGLVYGKIIYNKSPMVMAMMERMLGEDNFRDGLREYLKTYAYGNATWEGLIAIMDRYTDKNLKKWSNTWISEKGMPEIKAYVNDRRLKLTQTDPYSRKLTWPQTLQYIVFYGDEFKRVKVDLEGKEASVNLGLPAKTYTHDQFTVIPNTDGRGYGYFRIGSASKGKIWKAFSRFNTSRKEDETLRGSLLITLYENMIRGNIKAGVYMEHMLEYLKEEKNPLLFSMALGYVENCQKIFEPAIGDVEKALWDLVEHSGNPSFRLQAFRAYANLCTSAAALDRLYGIWEKMEAPEKCQIGENDYIGLSYKLAIALPEKAADITARQLARISNPDRIREYRFISPAVSPDGAVRDSVFQALLNPANRIVEPWAASALAKLNHPLRRQEAVKYIRPGLEAMTGVQKTGDNFFPTDWARSLLGGHNSKEAGKIVDDFFAAHPDYPVMLGNKIRQQAHHLKCRKQID